MERRCDGVAAWLEAEFPKTRECRVPPEDMLWLHGRGFDPVDGDDCRWVREGDPLYVLEYGWGKYCGKAGGEGRGWRAEKQTVDRESGMTDCLPGGFFRTPQAALADLWLRENRKDNGQQQ